MPLRERALALLMALAWSVVGIGSNCAGGGGCPHGWPRGGPCVAGACTFVTVCTRILVFRTSGSTTAITRSGGKEGADWDAGSRAPEGRLAAVPARFWGLPVRAPHARCAAPGPLAGRPPGLMSFQVAQSLLEGPAARARAAVAACVAWRAPCGGSFSSLFSHAARPLLRGLAPLQPATSLLFLRAIKTSLESPLRVPAPLSTPRAFDP